MGEKFGLVYLVLMTEPRCEDKKYVPVILCGGSGSRLYPLSRENKPKQFLALTNELSLLQNTILRFRESEEIYLISNQSHEAILFFQLKELVDRGLLAKEVKITVVLEPFSKNTAPAVGFVCNLVKGRNLLVLPCDHIYDDRMLLAAIDTAKGTKASITTIGKQPTFPATGFGYLLYNEAGKCVTQFIEKPSKEKAEGYLATGKYFWNSGIFLLKSDEVKALMDIHLPKTMEVIASLGIERRVHLGFNVVTIDPSYDRCENISIDYGLMEKMAVDTIGMIKYVGNWYDIGSFGSVHSVRAEMKTEEKKVEPMYENAGNCYVHSDKLVMLSDVKDLVVVDTPGVLMICSLDKSENVKKLYERVKREKMKEASYGNVEYFSWGVREILVSGVGFLVSKISVYPGCQVEFEVARVGMMKKRWTVIQGACRVIKGAGEHVMAEGDDLLVEALMTARVINESDTNLVLLENMTQAVSRV